MSSRSRRRGGSPVRRRISSTRRLSSPPLSWWALTLTETSTPLLARSVQARSSTQPPTALMSPLSSASGMKSAGRRRPSWGWFQRTNASRPCAVPVARSTMGWYSSTRPPSVRARSRALRRLRRRLIGSVRRRSNSWTRPWPMDLAAYIAVSASRSSSSAMSVGSPSCAIRSRVAIPMLAVSVTVLVPELEGLGQRAQDPIGRGARLVGRCLLEQEGELVAAEPADAVLRPRHRAEPGTHQPQQLVAGGVPEGVVDVLELVEVDEEHRDAHGRVPATNEGVRQAIGEEDAVRQARSADRAAPGAGAGPRGACGR